MNKSLEHKLREMEAMDVVEMLRMGDFHPALHADINMRRTAKALASALLDLHDNAYFKNPTATRKTMAELADKLGCE